MRRHRIKVAARREGLRRGIALLPSICTTVSLFCGFFSITKSLAGSYTAAAWFIVLAGLFDLIDGRIARLTHAESAFGIAYDSLADLSSFGLAPCILIYSWALDDLGRMGALMTFLYFACGALRLARYNVQHDNIESKYFQGLPIPAAASVLITYVLFHDSVLNSFSAKNIVAAIGTMVLALLMVSTINYRSMKLLTLRGRRPFFALVIVVIGIFVIALKPEIMLFSLSTVYVASGLIEELVTLRQSRRLVSHVQRRRREQRQKLKVITDADVRSLPSRDQH